MNRLCSIFCLLALTGFCQKEAAQWHFGNYASLNFQNGAPVTIGTSNLWTQFSSSGISDSAGNLLFYVRGGDIIYNKNNDTMANGLNIGGHYSGAQSSIVIRKSGSRYYVITHNQANHFAPSPFPPVINYALVDMSLAAGLGSVTALNLPISPTGTPMVSKLAVTRHCNQKDHWLLAHTGSIPGNNQYYAYLVTSSSISATSVISAIGSNQPHNYGSIPGFYRGLHKFSPNGRKVCATLPFRTVELYDFDNSTGALSNALKLDSIINPPAVYTYSTPNSLGIEFSPDGTKLYISYSNDQNFLCQYNLCAGSPSAIAASKIVLSNNAITSNVTSVYALQLAPDGKIYVATTNSLTLGVINNPNAAGALCSYSPQAVGLGTILVNPFVATSNMSGLPNFTSSFFEQKPTIPSISGSITCGNAGFNSPILCSAAGYSITSYQWNFGDPVSGSSNSAAISNPNHGFSANGNYTVQLILKYPCGADTLRKTLNIIGLPELGVIGKSNICKGESVKLNFSGATSYSLNGSSVIQSSVIVQPTVTTIYTLSGSNAGTGCQSLKLFTLNVSPCTVITNTIQYSGRVYIFPNPSKGIFTIELSVETTIIITDVIGRMVYKEILPGGKFEINLNVYPDGVYILSAKMKNESQKLKLIKDSEH